MSAELVVRVQNTAPAPQGSMWGRCLVDAKHRVAVTADNKGTKPWRKAIVEAAENAMLAVAWIPLDEALAIEITFWLPRPKTVRRLFPSTRPDIDKLARSSLDGLADSGAITEDGRVVDLTVRKRYADGRPPGATIRIGPLPVPEVHGERPAGGSAHVA